MTLSRSQVSELLHVLPPLPGRVLPAPSAVWLHFAWLCKELTCRKGIFYTIFLTALNFTAKLVEGGRFPAVTGGCVCVAGGNVGAFCLNKRVLVLQWARGGWFFFHRGVRGSEGGDTALMWHRVRSTHPARGCFLLGNPGGVWPGQGDVAASEVTLAAPTPENQPRGVSAAPAFCSPAPQPQHRRG